MTDTSLIEIKQSPPGPMHEGQMRVTKDAKRSGRRENGDPATLGLARDLASPGLRATLVWQIVRSLFRLSFAGLMAIFAGQMIADGTFTAAALAGAIVSLVAAGGAGYLGDLRAAGAERDVVDALRTALRGALAQMPPARVRSQAGALIAGLQRHPEALASLVTGDAAARSMLGIGPMLAAAAVAFVSWQAALTLLLAVPIMIVFFVVLGAVAGSKAAAQERAFGRLAAQFSDRIRTLPTILANHALGREHGKIERRMTAYADSTMSLLNVVFSTPASSISSRRWRSLCWPYSSASVISDFCTPRLYRARPVAEFIHSDHCGRFLRAVPPLRRTISRQGRGRGGGQRAAVVFRRHRSGIGV